jgi:hypothetical protein
MSTIQVGKYKIKQAVKKEKAPYPFILSTFIVTFNTNTSVYDEALITRMMEGLKSWYQNITKFLVPDSRNLKDRKTGGYQVDEDGEPLHVFDINKIGHIEIELDDDNIELGLTGRLHVHIPALRFIHNTFIQINAQVSQQYLNEFIGLPGCYLNIKYYKDNSWLAKNYARKEWGWKKAVPR